MNLLTLYLTPLGTRGDGINVTQVAKHCPIMAVCMYALVILQMSEPLIFSSWYDLMKM